MAEENFGLMVEIEAGLNEMLGGFKGTLWLNKILQKHGGKELYISKSTDLYKRFRANSIEQSLPAVIVRRLLLSGI